MYLSLFHLASSRRCSEAPTCPETAPARSSIARRFGPWATFVCSRSPRAHPGNTMKALSMKAKAIHLCAALALVVAVAADPEGISVRPALAQEIPHRAKSHARHAPHVLKARTQIEAHLKRRFCEDSTPIGDTITAEFHPPHVLVSLPRWWPDQFDVVLRRLVPVTAADTALPAFAVVRATVDGVVVPNVKGTFRVDVESGTRECYSILDGALTNQLRVR